MPKQVFTLNDFSGGLNTDKSDRALEDNELAECTNFDVSSKGKIVASRIFLDDDTLYADQTSSAIVTGYGLFAFSNDFEVSFIHSKYVATYIIKILLIVKEPLIPFISIFAIDAVKNILSKKEGISIIDFWGFNLNDSNNARNEFLYFCNTSNLAIITSNSMSFEDDFSKEDVSFFKR